MDRGSDSQGCHSHSWALISPSVKNGCSAEQKAGSEQSTEELALQSDTAHQAGPGLLLLILCALTSSSIKWA